MSWNEQTKTYEYSIGEKLYGVVVFAIVLIVVVILSYGIHKALSIGT